jgi:uncharacterized protein YcbX
VLADSLVTSTVASLWRYPVKSMQGQMVGELDFDSFGVTGDRAYGVLNRESGTILSAKREGRLLQAAAEYRSGVLVVTMPSGEQFHQGSRLDAELSSWLGYSVALVIAATFGVPTFECPEDFERDDSAVVSWEGTNGRFIDESPLHFLTSSDLEQLAGERPDLEWDVRRFRPNIVINDENGGLDTSPQRRIKLGDVEIEVINPCTRCVMTTRPQPGGLERQLDVLRHVSRHHDSNVGTRARVVRPGVVREGDDVKECLSP